MLILDNLESITGAHLAIQHTLSKEEQAALRSFLADLTKGQTRVLLGSRSGEDWLAKGAFDDNIYDLPGLDDEAASTLADRILEKCHATQYRNDERLNTLIKLLDGFPLAMEVVLTNLAKQTPQEILEALQAGDVKIDPQSDSQEKTASILRCIDYSHSNLSPVAQQLLLCLAPFTTAIDTQVLNNYTKHLKQQPLLATLPFDRWQEVIHEAQNWGLLSADSEIPRLLRLQPTLAYFLRNRLSTSGQLDVRRAIEIAFREHYDELGGLLNTWLRSKEPRERQVGQLQTNLEYENLVTALNLALEAQVSVHNPYFALSRYFDATQDQNHGLHLGRSVLNGLETYLSDKLDSQLGLEFAHIIGDIALRQFKLRRYIEAEESFQKLLQLVSQLKSMSQKEQSNLKALAYHGLGGVAQKQRQWPQAEQYYQHALQLFIDFNDRYGQAGTYHQLGLVAQEQRQWPQAEQYYQHALQLFIDFNDRHSQASSYHGLGMVFQGQRQWQQAEQYYQQALQLYIEYNDRYSQAATYAQLGLVAQEQRHWQRAEQYNQQALQLYIEYNDRYNQAKVYHELGRVAQEQRQWQQAEQYYQQALPLYSEYNDRYSQASTYHQLGIVALEQRQWQQAEQYNQQALQLYIEYNDRYNQASTYHQLGMVAQKQQQWQQAKQYYQQALQIKTQLNDRYAQASTYHQLGRVAQEQRQWQQAGEYLLQALQTFVEYKDNYNAGFALRSLARLWKASREVSVPAQVSKALGMSVEETEKLLREALEVQEEKKTGGGEKKE